MHHPFKKCKIINQTTSIVVHVEIEKKIIKTRKMKILDLKNVSYPKMTEQDGYC